MNRFLRSAGLPLAVLPEPKVAAGCSRDELAAEILKSQIVFQCATKPPSMDSARFLSRLLYQHMEREAVGLDAAIEQFRDAITGTDQIAEEARNELLGCLDKAPMLAEDRDALRDVLDWAKPEDIRQLFGPRSLKERSWPGTPDGFGGAFGTMLRGVRENTPLTLEHVDEFTGKVPLVRYAIGLGTDAARLRITTALATFGQRIGEAQSNGEKRLAVAQAIKDLGVPPLFREPDMVLIVMHRMMFDAGLSPAKLDEDDAQFLLVPDLPTNRIAAHLLQGQFSFQNKLASALGRGLDAELASAETREAEGKLHAQLQQIPALAGLRREEIWRLFASGREQDALGPLTPKQAFLLDREKGSLASSARAFGVMLTGFQNKMPLTAEHVWAINEAGPRPGFRERPTVVTFRAPESDVDLGQIVDLDGLKQDPWFAGAQISVGDRQGGSRTSNRDYVVSLPSEKSPDDCRGRLDAILSRYRDEIQGAHNEADKRIVIARAVRDLYRSQIFPDGERQATVFIVMNRMLLDAELSPAILSDPAEIFGLTGMPLRLAIFHGQLNLEAMIKPTNQDELGFPEDSRSDQDDGFPDQQYNVGLYDPVEVVEDGDDEPLIVKDE